MQKKIVFIGILTVLLLNCKKKDSRFLLKDKTIPVSPGWYPQTLLSIQEKFKSLRYQIAKRSDKIIIE